eukprot:1413103-Pyramimonas_sp.AAC.1
MGPSSSSDRDLVAGCIRPRHGSAEACTVVYESPCLHGGSGVLPCDMDRGLDSITIAAVPGPNGDADEGSGGVDFVDIDAPPDCDPYDADIE